MRSISKQFLAKYRTFSKTKSFLSHKIEELKYDEKKEPLKLFSIGVLGASVGTIAGVGAGIILIPLLANLTNLNRHQSSAASLAGVFGNALSTGLTMYLMGASVDIMSVCLIGVFGAISSSFGAKYGKDLTENQLAVSFAILMLGVGVFVFVYDYYKTNERKDVEGKYYIHSAAGLVIGFVSGLLGIGGATFSVPLLFSTTTLSHLNLVGTSLTSTLFPSIVGLFTHHKLGNLHLKKASFVALGAIIGGSIGTKVAGHIDDKYLKKAFSVFAILLGLRKIIAFKFQNKTSILKYWHQISANFYKNEMISSKETKIFTMVLT